MLLVGCLHSISTNLCERDLAVLGNRWGWERQVFDSGYEQVSLDAAAQKHFSVTDEQVVRRMDMATQGRASGDPKHDSTPEKNDECFFSILSKQGLAHSVQRSKQDLKDLLHRFLASYNTTCGPFTWTKDPEQLQHTIETTKEYQATHPRKPRRRRARRKKGDSIKN
jgi:hypothetical protein